MGHLDHKGFSLGTIKEKGTHDPPPPLVNEIKINSLSKFFSREILAKSDFLGSMKDARIFLVGFPADLSNKIC